MIVYLLVDQDRPSRACSEGERLFISIVYILLTHTHTYQLQAPTNIHSCSKWYSIIVSAAHTYATRLHSPPKIISWLRELVGQWGDSATLTPGSQDYVAPLLAALALRHCDNELLPSLLKAFGALAKAEPTLVGSTHCLSSNLNPLSPSLSPPPHSLPPSSHSYSTSSLGTPVPIPNWPYSIPFQH